MAVHSVGSMADAALTLIVPDPSAMRDLGRDLGVASAPGDVICLYGELGAGKTVLAKGIGEGLGVEETVSSPSFILMAEYAGRLPLFHIDLYRLADGAEAVAGGLLDERQAEGVTVIEWAERLGPDLPVARLDIRIEGTDGTMEGGTANDGTANAATANAATADSAPGPVIPRRVELKGTDDRHRDVLMRAVSNGGASRASSARGSE